MNSSLSLPPLDPVHFLRTAVDAFDPWISPRGEVLDPVFGESFQYGTAYYAYAQAVLAEHESVETRSARFDQARRSAECAAAHVLDIKLKPNASSMAFPTGEVYHGNHRDFFWPPLWKIQRLLQREDGPGAQALTDQLTSIDPFVAFNARPPSNWAAVWLSGEWLRIQSGFSPLSVEDFDALLDPFFQTHISLDQGFFHEPGHPNSYDLFTRYHFLQLQDEGYCGRHLPALKILLENGLRRSLLVQLSDGSLATAHRSSGQTWTLGCQCAYFSLAAKLLADDQPALVAAARRAAGLAYHSLIRWQRPGDVYSPVENVLPASDRIGYEAYSADANYSNLALAFLADAISYGFRAAAPAAELEQSPPQCLLEGDPLFRAVVRAGPYSAHLNGFPEPHYDTVGLADVSFGPGRYLHFVSPVTHLVTDERFVPGLARRRASDRGPLTRPASERSFPITPPEAFGSAGVRMQMRSVGKVGLHGIEIEVDAENGVRYTETFHGKSHLTWIIPYLLDCGDGRRTRVDRSQLEEASRILLHLGDETISISFKARVSHLLNLTHGYVSRRGLCGLLRIDLAEPAAEATIVFRRETSQASLA